MKLSDTLNYARSLLGKNEDDGSFKPIIDLYNTQKSLPRGYAVKYTDDWCAAFVSVLAVHLGGVGTVIPTECSAPKMMQMFKDRGQLIFANAYTPVPGDIVFFDWNYNGSPNHVAICEEVKNGCVITIDGNKKRSVAYRTTELDSKVLLAYAHPPYEAESGSEPVPTTTGYTQEQFIRDVQAVTGSVVDGDAGPQTIGNTPTLSRSLNDWHKAVLPVQKYLKELGFYSDDLDGHFGHNTEKAVKAYQKAKKLRWVDGIITAKNLTWRCLLGMEG